MFRFLSVAALTIGMLLTNLAVFATPVERTAAHAASVISTDASDLIVGDDGPGLGGGY